MSFLVPFRACILEATQPDNAWSSVLKDERRRIHMATEDDKGGNDVPGNAWAEFNDRQGCTSETTHLEKRCPAARREAVSANLDDFRRRTAAQRLPAPRRSPLEGRFEGTTALSVVYCAASLGDGRWEWNEARPS